MQDAQGRQAGPGLRLLGQLVTSQRRQHEDAGEQLDQRDQVRRRAGEAFDDQRRHCIEQRSAQCQGDAQQVVLARGAAIAMGTDDGQHAEEGHTQPGQLGQGDALAEQQRGQAHQHERLHVIDRRADGDGRLGVGGEQQQPVTNDGHAADQRQDQHAATEQLAAQQAERGADQQQHGAADHAAPEHHVDHRLAGHQHKPADGAGNQHRRDHFQRAALEGLVHGRSLRLGCAHYSATRTLTSRANLRRNRSIAFITKANPLKNLTGTP